MARASPGSSCAPRSATPAPPSSCRCCCSAGRSSSCPTSSPGWCWRPSRKSASRPRCSCPRCSTCSWTTPTSPTRDLSSLETVYYGAAAMSPTRLKEAIDRLGPIFFQYYGQAEGPMTICVLRKDEHDTSDMARLATCGRPVPWVHVEAARRRPQRGAAGRAGRDLRAGPAGHAGLLEQARADGRGAGRRLAAHRRHRPRGRGRLLHDRRPQEGHDRDAAGSTCSPARSRTSSRRTPRWPTWPSSACPTTAGARRSRPSSCCGPSAESVEADELIELVKAAKGSIQAPKSVDFADEIPLSPLGKPDKKALRPQYWAGTDRQVN